MATDSLRRYWWGAAGLIIGAGIAFPVGFYLGMEYFKNKLRRKFPWLPEAILDQLAFTISSTGLTAPVTPAATGLKPTPVIDVLGQVEYKKKGKVVTSKTLNIDDTAFAGSTATAEIT